MKWVRCIKKDGYRLSEGDIYKVLDFYNNQVAFNGAGLIVKINDNYGHDSYYSMRGRLEDVSLEVERDKKLNKLLEYDKCKD